MTLDDLWNSPGNTPTMVERDSLVSQTMLRVARERRRRKGMTAFTTALLLLASAPAIAYRVTHPEGFGSSSILYLMLASQWLLLLYWVRQLRRGSGDVAGADGSIQDSLRRLLREVDAERRSQWGVVLLYAVFTPLLAVAIGQLIAAGKMAPDEALSGALIFLVIAVVALGSILWRLYRRVLPRRRRLQALLAQFEAAGGAANEAP